MTFNFKLMKETLKPKLKKARETVYLLNRNPLSRISLIVIVVIVLLAVLAPLIIPYPSHIADRANIEDKFVQPGRTYFFGTDELGRDIFSRVIYGTRVSLMTSVVAVLLALLIGVPLGAVAGSLGGVTDEIIMRFTDVFLSFPPLLLAIAMVSILGPSLNNAIIAIAISWWPWYTRIVRGQAISLKERNFVLAAHTIGTSRTKIIFRHILPNTISPVVVQASMDMGGVILTIASLSFLGLGAQAPTPEWGLMISTGRNFFPDMWWYSIFPGLAIFFTVLCFNILGDSIREILDPKTRNK